MLKPSDLSTLDQLNREAECIEKKYEQRVALHREYVRVCTPVLLLSSLFIFVVRLSHLRIEFSQAARAAAALGLLNVLVMTLLALQLVYLGFFRWLGWRRILRAYKELH